MSDETEDQVSGGPLKEPAPIDSNTIRPRFGKPGQQVLSSQSQDQASNSPSISLHPGNLEHGELFTEATKPYVQAARSAFDTATKAIQAIYDARRDVPLSAYASEDGYWCAIADVASRNQDRATAAMDSAARSLTAAIAHTRTELETPIKSAATRAMSAEIRAHAAALSPSKRNELIKTGSRDTLDAILGAEHYLSGLTETEKTVHLRAYFDKYAPDNALRLRAMEAALELVNTRGPLVLREVERALGKSWTFIDVVRKRKAKADAALAG
jgi:hypothetical protein